MRSILESRPLVSRTARRLLAPLFALVALSVPGLAAAHLGSTKAIEVTPTEAGAQLAVSIDAVDAALAVGLPVTAAPERLLERAPLLAGWLASGLSLTSDEGPCTASTGAPQLTTREDRPAVAVAVAFACPAGTTNLRLRDDTIFEEDPDHEVFVALAGRDGQGEAAGVVLRADAREVVISTPPTMWTTAKAFVGEGAIHLVTGYDHLLFLLSLILVAGLSAKKQGLRPALVDVAKVVTAFTLGHSISLVAASLGWVALPSQLVESVIAASIIVVAGINIAKPTAGISRWPIAGAFGLVHGFGFSSVLADVGLPTAARAVALGAFNVGIELAQLAFVAIVMLPLVWAARHRAYPLVVVRGGSVAIAALGCVWLAERTLGL
jgi:hypothetical protein